MERLINGQVDGWTDRWTEEQMDGNRGRQTDGWIVILVK